MKGLESMRLEMIVVATLIVKFVLQKFKLNRLIQSNFALKEGAIFEVLNLKTATL
jgi:exopolyphosphatase/guanosine-5'-triphosphate,3'-diphosphate pyrophosphatase